LFAQLGQFIEVVCLDSGLNDTLKPVTKYFIVSTTIASQKEF